VQSIFYSSYPILFTVVASITLVFFILCKGSVIPVYILTAAGPLVNITALYCNSYIYNIEIVLLTYLGCLFWKNASKYFPQKIDIMSISCIVLLITFSILTIIHITIYDKNALYEIRLMRVFVIGGFFLFFLNSIELKQLHIYYKTTLLTALFISIAGLSELGYRGIILHSYLHEPHSVFNGSEILAVYLCTTIPLILTGKRALEKKQWQYLAIFTVFLEILLLLATRSRTGILSLICFLIFFGLYIIRNNIPKKMPVIIAVFFILSAATATVIFKTFNAMNISLDNLPALLFSSRLQAWSDGIMSFSKFPLFGNGAGNNVYNIYLQLLCQYGIWGFATFTIFTIFVFVKYNHIKRIASHNHIGIGLFCSICAFLIAGIGESAIGNQFGYYILFIMFLAGINKNAANNKSIGAN
jgi:hypothetical protein